MVLGICGYGYSGSGAVMDLINGYSNVSVAWDGQEFIYVYTPDGILDLEYDLMICPRRFMSSDISIRRYLDITRFDGLKINKLSKSRLRTDFRKRSMRYIEDITQIKWRGSRPFSFRNKGIAGLLYFKIFGLAEGIVNRHLHKKIHFIPYTDLFFSYNTENFEEISKKYIMDLLEMTCENKEIIAINQPFPADNPVKCFKYFEDPYAIIVDRDPRDIYITAKYYYPNIANWVPVDTAEHFIKYYAQMRSNTIDDNRILKIRFEDLIYDYSTTVKRIENFAGTVGFPSKGFDPHISIKNTQLFRLYENERKNIEKIENSLNQWLYPFKERDVLQRPNEVF